MVISEALSLGVSRMVVEKLQARGLERFTAAQAAALNAGLCAGASLLVVAPTSSGKTTVAELAAAEGARQGHRTVYLVSHRALAEEKYRLFAREYAAFGAKWFDVSIATGDHVEGEWATGILISTYEKYLSMLCSVGNLDLPGTVVVADEIQILADETRGPEIELLCTLLRRGAPRQIVALSATISNPQVIGGWLGCRVVETTVRDVPLQQEVWFQGGSITCLAGGHEPFEGRRKGPLPLDTLSAVEYLLRARQGPILVFTMTKPRALDLAQQLASRRQRTAEGLRYVDQLDLFSEPSTLVRALSETAQRKIAFHTADLSYAERELIERALHERLFDVVFSTPTLAAGVNFPFQTVLFDSFYRRWMGDNPWLSLAEYQNMAGRAGRLGLHDRGFAILLADSEVYFDRARTMITAHVEPLESHFLSCSIRKVILAIIASRVIRQRSELLQFLRDTLWWHQTADRNQKRLESVPSLVDDALTYLQGVRFITSKGERVLATRLGVAAAATGLLPSTVVELMEVLRTYRAAFSQGIEAWIPGTLHLACASPEFAEHGQRHLPYSRREQPEGNAIFWLRARSLFIDPDTVEAMDRVANATYGLSEWIAGTPERTLRNMLPPITYGGMQQLATDVALIVEGISRVMRIPDANCPVALANALSALAEQLRYGVPSDVIDVLKAAAAYEVPGFGRMRAMALRDAKLSAPNDVLKADPKTVAKIVESEPRAQALFKALSQYFDAPLETLKVRHATRAQELRLDAALIARSYEALGESYEDPVEDLLRSVPGWKVTKLDKGKRQAYPDFLVEFLGKALLVECKTKQKNTATLSKDEAFAVLAKGTDFKKDHSVTIGKPDFDETSRSKSNGSTEITLVRHADFVEAVLRCHGGKATPEHFFQWFLTPGYARLEQLEALAMAALDPREPPE